MVRRFRAPGVRGPGPPSPGQRAPHQDFGQLATGLIGDGQSVGESICGVLDTPFDATIRIKGPHRLVDNALDYSGRLVQNTIREVTQ